MVNESRDKLSIHGERKRRYKRALERDGKRLGMKSREAKVI